MREIDQLILFGLVVVAFIVICLKVGGVVRLDRASYPRAYWFGIACFGVMVIMLGFVAIWDAVKSR